MLRLILLLLSIFFITNCAHKRIVEADDNIALTHKVIWDYVNTFDDLFPELKPPKVKYKRIDGFAYFSDNRNTIYLATYDQLTKAFKKQLIYWAEGAPKTITSRQLYNDWYMIMDLAAALSWYLTDHVGLVYLNHRKRIQNTYILAWIFLRENKFYGKKEKEWIQLIRHINKQARSQLGNIEIMVYYNSGFIKPDQSTAYYTYFNTLILLKSHQMSKKIEMSDLLQWFETQKKQNSDGVLQEEGL